MKLKTCKIKVMLAERKLTYSAFSKLCGISRQGLSNLFKKSTCNFATAGKIAEALSISVLEIIEEE